MKIYDKLYIGGEWIQPHSNDTSVVINPASEDVIAQVPAADAEDVSNAVAAARAAFHDWSQTSAEERSVLIGRIADRMEERRSDLIDAVSSAMGCPTQMTELLHIDGSIYCVRSYAERTFRMEDIQEVQHSLIVREPVGVCAFITPWNYPLHQLVGKVAPALAAGCTIIAKPAGQTPLQDMVMAEIFDEVGLPAGVFNLVTGSGSVVGAGISDHPDVDMVSFTGSTQVGIQIAKAGAPTVKRVALELGGKSPYIITEDADHEKAVAYGVQDVMLNTGQSCNALTRMLVHRNRYNEAVEIAKAVAEGYSIGTGDAFMGPMSSSAQKQIVMSYIEKGIDEGATLVTGGTDTPEGCEKGFYVKPTIFADVNNEMTIAREEIFGPVLCMIAYNDPDEAIEIANDTLFGLAGGVYARTSNEALKIARQIRAGCCVIQGGEFNYDAPFGGFKQSGNGREFGEEGLMEFVEIKSIHMGKD